MNLIARKVPIIAILALLAWAHADVRANVLYVSNFGANTITAYDSTTGAFLDTPVTAGAEANGFNGVRVDAAGNFFVTGQLTNNIVEYNSSGALLRVFDPANLAGLNSPQDLVFGPDGKLYVLSSANDKVLRYDALTGAFVDTFADLGSAGHVGPIGLAFGSDGNLYVTSFDNGQVTRIDGLTGAVLATTPGPAGFGFGSAVFGPDGNLYISTVDLTTFAGSVYRYDTATSALANFVSPSAGGLQSAGGIAFAGSGNLLLANLVFDQTFSDIGSTILEYDGVTGAFSRTLVGAGNGLNIPFFMTITAPSVTAVPEPSTVALVGIILVLVLMQSRSRNRVVVHPSVRADLTTGLQAHFART